MHEKLNSGINDSTEFKKLVIDLLKSNEIAPELLQQVLLPLYKEKIDFLDDYKEDDKAEAISNDQNKWILGSGDYFDRHCRFLEQNFCKIRIEHLIQVKSYLIEYGIAGFSMPENNIHSDNSTAQTRENTMNNPFNNIDLNNFSPTPALQSVIESNDMTKIRMTLFMELNDHRLSTHRVRQIFAYIFKNKENLFVAYEESAYAQKMNKEDKQQWDAKYYALQEVYASSNFSYQRIEHMIEVREYVFTIPSHDNQAIQQKVVRQQQDNIDRKQQRVGSSSYDNNLKAIILIGGVIAAVAIFVLALLNRG